MASTNKKWYFLDESNLHRGPMSTQEITKLYEDGYVNGQTLFWCDGRHSWQYYTDIAELDAAFGVIEELTNKNRTKMNDDALEIFHQAIKGIEKGEDDINLNNNGDDEEEEVPNEKSFVDDDGTRYEWNPEIKKFQPKYALEDMTYVPDEEKIPSLEEILKQNMEGNKESKENKNKGDNKNNNNIKKNDDDDDDDDENTTATKESSTEDLGYPNKKKRKSNQDSPNEHKTTSVYITGLPDDVTEQEIAILFSKCGIIKEDEDGLKIKIYKHKETGMVKGDALVTYLKRPSVELAIQILDGTKFRDNIGMTMSVTEAVFDAKPPMVKEQKKKPKQKKKVDHQSKLLGWEGFDDHISINKVTVVLKNMFSPEELQGNDVEINELKEEIFNECIKIDRVEKVNIYESHPEGVATIRFTNEMSADKCVEIMNGRYFGGKKITAHKWDGFTKYGYKKRIEKKNNVHVQKEEEQRLEKYAEDIEKNK